ncbi:MAG: hypothetical protein F6J93_37665 [Oscillatoria sp. SIO1A7]|nr:hypothetical protein [Oscillatoria sp. SIO1A7]
MVNIGQLVEAESAIASSASFPEKHLPVVVGQYVLQILQIIPRQFWYVDSNRASAFF